MFALLLIGLTIAKYYYTYPKSQYVFPNVKFVLLKNKSKRIQARSIVQTYVTALLKWKSDIS